MGIMVGLPSPSGSEKDLQLNFGKNMTVQVEMRAPRRPHPAIRKPATRSPRAPPSSSPASDQP